MSFATDVKKELCQKAIEKPTAKAELCGILMAFREFSFDKIPLQTGNQDTANRCVELLKKVFDITEEVLEGGNKRIELKYCFFKRKNTLSN